MKLPILLIISDTVLEEFDDRQAESLLVVITCNGKFKQLLGLKKSEYKLLFKE